MSKRNLLKLAVWTLVVSLILSLALTSHDLLSNESTRFKLLMLLGTLVVTVLIVGPALYGFRQQQNKRREEAEERSRIYGYISVTKRWMLRRRSRCARVTIPRPWRLGNLLRTYVPYRWTPGIVLLARRRRDSIQRLNVLESLRIEKVIETPLYRASSQVAEYAVLQEPAFALLALADLHR
jgi:hypothetical protein